MRKPRRLLAIVELDAMAHPGPETAGRLAATLDARLGIQASGWWALATLGRGARGRPYEALAGATAERLLERADCDLLIVPRPGTGTRRTGRRVVR